MTLVRSFKLLLAVDKFTNDVTKGKNVNWIPSILTLALTVLGLFNPQIQGFITAHPTAGVAIGGIYAVLKGLMPSPLAPATNAVSNATQKQ